MSLSTRISSKLHNKSINRQIAITTIKIILEIFSNTELDKVLNFFEYTIEDYTVKVENILVSEYSRVIDLIDPITNYLSIKSITSEQRLCNNNSFIKAINESLTPYNDPTNK